MVQNQDDDVRPDWQAVAKVGVPGAIAMFLVYQLAGGFEKFDKRLGNIENQHTTAAQQTFDAKDLAGRALMTNEKVLWVLQAMCANDARNNEARERCFALAGR